MRKTPRRQYAVAAAIANIAKCSDATVLDALCARMMTLAVAGRMMKCPWQEQEARKILAIAEKRLVELRSQGARSIIGSEPQVIGRGLDYSGLRQEEHMEGQ
ncbi:MAG: hypothetical protein ACR650_05670 [Methylocystis sp.]|uniref:hypothetical protein n=1 Tax=Methylocystis sp. TaxID=1911079 RepID=UPI003DA276C3